MSQSIRYCLLKSEIDDRSSMKRGKLYNIDYIIVIPDKSGYGLFAISSICPR